jgi:hypothetical protein
VDWLPEHEASQQVEPVVTEYADVMQDPEEQMAELLQAKEQEQES